MYMNQRETITALSIALGIVVSSSAFAIDDKIPNYNISADHYYSVDTKTGYVFASKSADKKTEIASLTKVMTAYIVFDSLKSEAISLDEEVSVSVKAWKTGGSRMFIEPNNPVKVEDLVKGMIVVSGNDASVALAEYISGSEEAFTDLMNSYAKSLGMNNTKFTNATGLPTSSEQYSTAYDVAILSKKIKENFPEYFKLFSLNSFEYNNISQLNRNKLLRESKGFNGLKTGYTVKSGYSLASSFERKDRDIITIVLNAKTPKDRFYAAKAISNNAYLNFNNIDLIKKDVPVTKMNVAYGEVKEIPIYPLNDISITVKTPFDKNDISVVAKLETNGDYKNLIFAPLTEKYVTGEVKVMYKGEVVGTSPLITKDIVNKSGVFSRIIDWIKIKVFKVFS